MIQESFVRRECSSTSGKVSQSGESKVEDFRKHFRGSSLSMRAKAFTIEALLNSKTTEDFDEMSVEDLESDDLEDTASLHVDDEIVAKKFERRKFRDFTDDNLASSGINSAKSSDSYQGKLTGKNVSHSPGDDDMENNIIDFERRRHFDDSANALKCHLKHQVKMEEDGDDLNNNSGENSDVDVDYHSSSENEAGGYCDSTMRDKSVHSNSNKSSNELFSSFLSPQGATYPSMEFNNNSSSSSNNDNSGRISQLKQHSRYFLTSSKDKHHHHHHHNHQQRPEPSSRHKVPPLFEDSTRDFTPLSDVTMNLMRLGEEDVNERSRLMCRLETKELWSKFYELGTEMIITKSGRFDWRVVDDLMLWWQVFE